MNKRRKFITNSLSVMGLAALGPSISFSALAKKVRPPSAKDRFRPLRKSRQWLALYDQQGSYISDVTLKKIYQDCSNADVEQFSLRWLIKKRHLLLEPGTYLFDDFETEPFSLYLEPSEGRQPGRFYRAVYSVLRSPLS